MFFASTDRRCCVVDNKELQNPECEMSSPRATLSILTGLTGLPLIKAAVSKEVDLETAPA